jgi:hypothetical protein
MTINGNVGLDKKTFLERMFPSINVEVSNDSRVVTLVNLNDLVRNDKTIYIFESSTVEGFKGGKWAEVKDIVIEGKKAVSKKNTMKLVNFDEPADLKGLVTLVDDNGVYITQQYKNIILLSTSLSNLPDKFLEMVFGLMGYKPISEEDHIIRKMQDLFKTRVGSSVADLKNKVDNENKEMKKFVEAYTQHYVQRMSYERTLEGAEKYDENKLEGIVKNIKNVFKNPQVESVELSGDIIVIITKNLYMGVWDIGQYSIAYDPKSSMPRIKRITSPAFPKDKAIMVISAGGGWDGSGGIDHPHIRDESPCTGNFGDMLEAFWTKDMLTGTILAIQYIRSYSRDTGPHFVFEKWLSSLGYVSDSMKLTGENTISVVDNGKVKMKGFSEEATKKKLDGLGVTGKKDKDKNVIEKFFLESSNGKDSSYEPSIEYVDWRDHQQPK